MKKIAILLGFMAGLSMGAAADTINVTAGATTQGLPPAPLATPTPFQPLTLLSGIPIGEQFSAGVLQHGVAATAFESHGQTRSVTLLTPFEAVKYKGDFVIGQDDGVAGNIVNSGRMAGTFGIHVHIISLLRNYMTDSTLLDYIDATPRYAWYSDVHRWAWEYLVGFSMKYGGATGQ